MKKNIIISAIALAVGFYLGVIVNDIPWVSFRKELGLSDIFYVVFIVIVGYIVQEVQRKQSETFTNAQNQLSNSFSAELQRRDISFSKKQKFLERLHEECFEAISYIDELISENIKGQGQLGDELKKIVQLKWKVISQRVNRISVLCAYNELNNLGVELHDSILGENFALTDFKYDNELHRIFIVKSENLKNKLDELIFIN